MIEENMWRAIRYGLDGELLDLERGDAYPARAAVDRLLTDRARPWRARPGDRAAGAQRRATPAALLAEGMSLSEA